MARSNYEKETIMLTNEEDNIWNVFTYNSKMKKKLETFAAEFPALCTLKSESSDGSVEYEVKKDRVFINFRGPVSREEHDRMSNAAKSRFWSENH